MRYINPRFTLHYITLQYNKKLTRLKPELFDSECFCLKNSSTQKNGWHVNGEM